MRFLPTKDSWWDSISSLLHRKTLDPSRDKATVHYLRHIVGSPFFFIRTLVSRYASVGLLYIIRIPPLLARTIPRLMILAFSVLSSPKSTAFVERTYTLHSPFTLQIDLVPRLILLRLVKSSRYASWLSKRESIPLVHKRLSKVGLLSLF